MKIVHLLRSYCSGAPDALSKKLSSLDGIDSQVIQVKADAADDMFNAITSDRELMYKLSRADIVHWHNIFINIELSAKQIVTFHGPPENNIIKYSLKQVKLNKRVIKTVVAHYHVSLDAYKGYHGVRNIVDVSIPTYDTYQPGEDILIGMTPTPDQLNTIWQRKGLEQTMLVMERVSDRLPNVKFRMLTNRPYYESLRFKNECNIVLDECITPSYHLCSLEGIALGKPTVCWLDDRVESTLKRITGADNIPFINSHICWLEDVLYENITKGTQHLNAIGKQSKEWFKKYWKTSDILNEYLRIYA